MKKSCCNSCNGAFDGGSVGMACPQCGEGILIEDSLSQLSRTASPQATTLRQSFGVTPPIAQIEPHTVSEMAASREVRKSAASAETNAFWLMTIGLLLIVGGVVASIIAVTSSGLFSVGGTFLLLGFVENIRAQLLHIRANLDRR